MTALVGVAVLLLAACAERGGPAAEGSGEATITITSPKDGESAASPVKLVVTGAEIGATDTGLMHLHVYVDDSSQYEVVESAESEVSVPAGEHTLRVVLAEANHQETAASASVSIMVTGGAGGSPSPGGDDYGVGY